MGSRLTAALLALVAITPAAAAHPGAGTVDPRPCPPEAPTCQAEAVAVTSTTLTITLEPIPLAPIPSTPRFTG